MPSLDPETREWIERARRGEKPYSYIEKNGLQVVSLVRDQSLTIQETIVAEGHAWWRAVNQSTVRPRRVRITARMKDRRGVWMPDQGVQGDGYYIDETIPRTKKGDQTFFTLDWSARFCVQKVGAETVVATCHGCKDLLTSAFVIHPQTPNGSPPKARKIFISHSSHDKPFVRRLIADLQSKNLDAWFDEKSLEVGDSLVESISRGLESTDYFMVVLSAHAAQSRWVQEELNAALVNQIAGRGGVVLPVRLDDTELPVLLRNRLYADFRRDYGTGLESLLRVLRQENETAGAMNTTGPGMRSDAVTQLLNMKLADLRRFMMHRLRRDEVSTLWFDLFSARMDDDMANRDLTSCVIELLLRAQDRDLLASLINHLLENRPDLKRVLTC